MLDSFFEKIIIIILLSASPFSELRGGIPVGLGLGLEPLFVILLSMFINCLVFFPVYFGLKFFYNKIFYKWSIARYFVERTRRKGKPYIEKYGLFGLAIFVAIPLPVTGAWTGSALAWLLGLDWKKSFVAVSLGVIIAGIVVSAISLGVLAGLKFLL